MMKRSRSAPATLCMALLALTSACTHARTAADPSQEAQAAREAEQGGGNEAGDGKDADGKDDPKKSDGAGNASGEKSSSAEQRSGSGERDEGDSDEDDDEVDPEAIEVATSPQGLLKPGAEDQVRQKLGLAKGKSMRAALRKFQREHDLPATGMLDHETVERLGLEPSEIFEKAD